MLDIKKLMYTPDNFFKVYDIYSGIVVGENKIVSVELASASVGNFHQSFLKVDDNANDDDKELFYKAFLQNMIIRAKIDHVVNFASKEIIELEDIDSLKEIFNSTFDTRDYNALKDYFFRGLNENELEEIKELFSYFDLDMKNITNREACALNTYLDIKRYLKRYLEYIPEDILNTINNLKLYALGYMTSDTYNKFLQYRKTLETWLKNPMGTSNEFEMILDKNDDHLAKFDFHDNSFTFQFTNNDLILNSLTFPGGKVIFKECSILNDKFNNHLLENNYEGYTYDIVKNITNNKFLIKLNFIDIILYIEATEVIEDYSNFDRDKFLKDAFDYMQSI